jgi:hypothetical protein
MTWWAVLPFLAAVLVQVGGRSIARRLPPAFATYLITGAALTISLTCGLTLVAAAVLATAQLPMAGDLGHWSTGVVRHGGSMPAYPGFAAAVVVMVLLAMAVRRLALTARAERVAQRLVRDLPESHAELIIIPDQAPTAYAVGMIKGRIVVSTGMLAGLSVDQRRVLLAHEAAHLRHRHQWFVHLTALAVAANPLLRPLGPAVQTSTERWADESAAGEVGDRRLVATSLVRAAELRSPDRLPRGLGVAEGEIVLRVRALLAPQTAARWRLGLSVVAAAASCWLVSVLLVVRVHNLIEVAELRYIR